MRIVDNVLSIDIGGTNVRASLVNAAGQVSRIVRYPTLSHGRTAEAMATTVTLAIREALDGLGPSAVGIACAGPVDPLAGTVSPINLPGWRAFPLAELVAGQVPGAPVSLLGDAAAAALGEYAHGAGRGARAMLGMVVSTGIGGGLIVDGRLYTGPSGNAGHVGHLPAGIDLGDAPCTCHPQARGCVETVASARGMLGWARERGWVGDDVEQLAESARGGDTVAVEAFDRAGLALARAATVVGLTMDLDIVTIGGGIAGAEETLLAPMRRHLANQPVLSFARRAEVRGTILGDDAPLLGAAAYARRDQAAQPSTLTAAIPLGERPGQAPCH